MLILLGKEKDKNGREIEIIKTTGLAMSPIYTFFLREMADLIDEGYGYPATTWEDKNCEAVYATFDDKILGHIVYSKEYLQRNNLWITLGAVRKEERGLGIYTLLRKYFEGIAKEYDCSAITSHIHIKNKVGLSSAEKLGMKPIFYYTGKKLT
jgi:GNAT superfamily N-acetyltransferase